MNEQHSARPTETVVPAAFVDCQGMDPEIGMVSCGTVPLTMAQYERQMNCPDRPWMCPKCGAPADYNDEKSEEVQGVYDEPDEEREPDSFQSLGLSQSDFLP